MIPILPKSSGRPEHHVSASRGESVDPPQDSVVLMLNNKGMIRECSKTSRQVLGYPSSRLIWHHISMLLPQLENIQLTDGKRINPRLQFLSHIGHRFEVICPDGQHMESEMYINNVETSGNDYLRVILRPILS